VDWGGKAQHACSTLGQSTALCQGSSQQRAGSHNKGLAHTIEGLAASTEPATEKESVLGAGLWCGSPPLLKSSGQLQSGTTATSNAGPLPGARRQANAAQHSPARAHTHIHTSTHPYTEWTKRVAALSVHERTASVP